MTWRLFLFASFILLAGATLALFVFNLRGFMHRPVWLQAFSLLMLVGIAIETMLEWRRCRASGWHGDAIAIGDLFEVAAVLFGALATYMLSVYHGMGAVTASALMGTFAAIFLKRYALAIYCGSFVGMASDDVFQIWPCMVLAGMIAGVVFVAGKRFFNGFGGKLGTTALIGCLAAVALNPRPMLTLEMPGWNVGAWLIVYSMMGAVATFILNVRFSRGPVLASSLVGLTAGLLLPWLHGPDLGLSYAAAVFCASFVGMCGTERMAGEHWMALTGLICGLAFIQTTPYFGGAGGKLGTLAFGSVIAQRGLLHLVRGLRRGVSASIKPSRRNLPAGRRGASESGDP